MKRRHVVLEAVRKVLKNTDGIEYDIVEVTEVVEINDNMINVFTTDETRYSGSDVVCCSMKFIERKADGTHETLDWYIRCTIDQARRNMRMINGILTEMSENEIPKNKTLISIH